MIKNKTIVCWGAYKYFDSKIDIVKQKYKIDYIFPGDFPTDVNLRGIPAINKESIKELKNPVVVIAFAKYKDIKETIEFCVNAGVTYISIDILASGKINSTFIRAAGGKVIDDKENQICISLDSVGDVWIDVSASTKAVIEVGNVNVRDRLNIKMMGKNAKFKIGNGTSVFQMNVSVNSNGLVSIGKDCMISHHVDIAQSDQHLIFDMNTRKRINYPKNILVGNHVWLGRECQLLGGASIGDGSIVGSRCVTSKSCPTNCIMAGVPGKIIRANIIWSRDLVEKCEWDDFSQCIDQNALDYLPNN